MASPQLTVQQQQAIDCREVSVSLSAGAGCGKTHVLTERFLAHLDPVNISGSEPLDLSQLVAITFTDRAAREMRDRIRSKCYERLQNAGALNEEYFSKLLRRLDEARVSTIHSFCASQLRAHAVEAKIDPGFRVLEQPQADLLLAETLEDVLREQLAQSDSTTIHLAVQFGQDRIQNMIRNLLAERQNIDFDRWCKQTPQALVDLWEQYRKTMVIQRVLEKVKQSNEAFLVLDLLQNHVPSNDEMRRRRDVLLEQLPKLTESREAVAALETLKIIRENAKVQGGGTKNAWPSEDVYQDFMKAAKDLRELIDNHQDLLKMGTSEALTDAKAGLDLLCLAKKVAHRFDREKKKLGAMDFNDLLSRTKDLLTDSRNSSLRDKFSSQLGLLLVDEFQDTNEIQVELVEALCGGLPKAKLFFVGDFKQSIYRFRGARPQVFRRLQEKTPVQGRLQLTLNFRSQPAILNFVNALFYERFPEEGALQPKRRQISPEPAVEFLWALSESESKENVPVATLRKEEARWIARRIRKMLDDGQRIVLDKNSPENEPSARPVRQGDIALLFRALSDVQHYEEALQDCQIDYYLVGGHAFYAQQEIFDLLNLLRSLVNPRDEIALAGVLRSGFFSLRDETLFWLAQHPEGLSAGLFSEEVPKKLGMKQRTRAQFAAGTLRELRRCKDRMPVAQLINLALSRTGYDAILLGEFLGERKLANLRKIIDQARSLDRSGCFSLDDFVVELSEFVAEKPRESLAATQAESSDVVRLMTIHQAKGLEFPVVIIPDVDRPNRASSADAAFDPDLGPLVKVPSTQRLPANGKDLYSFVQNEEDLQELIRLLYVATTRAADHLILSSGLSNLDKPSGPWMNLLAKRFDLQTGNVLEDLPESFDEPKVMVTTDSKSLAKKPPSRRQSGDLGQLIQQFSELAQNPIGRAVDWTGPIFADRNARRQYSFSRLSGRLYERETEIDRSETGRNDGAVGDDPLALGSLVHNVLAKIDFAETPEVRSMVRHDAEKNLNIQSETADEAIELIQRFLKSPCARRLAEASQVHTEVEFMLAWPPDTPQRHGKYINGFIDCLYQDVQGNWHLLDYKTNRVSAGQVPVKSGEYEMQMFVYALAAQRVLASPLQSLTLHFLRPGTEQQFLWNDAVREQVTQMVDQSIKNGSEPRDE